MKKVDHKLDMYIGFDDTDYRLFEVSKSPPLSAIDGRVHTKGFNKLFWMVDICLQNIKFVYILGTF